MVLLWKIRSNLNKIVQTVPELVLQFKKKLSHLKISSNSIDKD